MWVIRAEYSHPVGEQLRELGGGAVRITSQAPPQSELMASAESVGMVVAEDPAGVGEDLRIFSDKSGKVNTPAQCKAALAPGKIVPGGERIGVVSAEDHYPVGEQRSKVGHSLFEVARLVACTGQGVPGREGIRVAGPERALPGVGQLPCDGHAPRVSAFSQPRQPGYQGRPGCTSGRGRAAARPACAAGCR